MLSFRPLRLILAVLGALLIFKLYKLGGAYDEHYLCLGFGSSELLDQQQW